MDAGCTSDKHVPCTAGRRWCPRGPHGQSNSRKIARSRPWPSRHDSHAHRVNVTCLRTVATARRRDLEMKVCRVRCSQSFSFHALRELGPALRSSRGEHSDGTLFTFQLPREPPFTCPGLVRGRRRPEPSPPMVLRQEAQARRRPVPIVHRRYHVGAAYEQRGFDLSR